MRSAGSPTAIIESPRETPNKGGVTRYGVFDMATIAAQAREDKAMSRDVPDAPEWQLRAVATPQRVAESISGTKSGRPG